MIKGPQIEELSALTTLLEKLADKVDEAVIYTMETCGQGIESDHILDSQRELNRLRGYIAARRRQLEMERTVRGEE